MSYPYAQFTAGDNFSTPTTPIDGFPPWETVQRDQEQQQPQQQQPPPPLQQQQQQEQEQQLHHSPTLPTPTFQLINLEDPHSRQLEQSSQPLESGTVDNTPIHLHHVHHDPARSVDVRLENSGNDFFRTLGYSDHEAHRSSSSASASASDVTKQVGGASTTTSSSMVMRSSRSTRQYAQAAHPYQRPQSATPVMSGGGGATTSGSSSTVTAAAEPGLSTVRSLMREAQVLGPGSLRFVHHNLIPTVVQPPPLVSSAPSTSSVVPSVVPSALPSPASASTGRMPGFGSVAGSPVTQLQGSTLLYASPQIPDNPPASIQPQRKKYVIRADTHYDPESGILVVMLELPGVEKKDVKLTLSTSRHNRIRQLKVWGVSDPALPVPTADVLSHFPDSCARERRFGEFSRTFSVPSDLKRENVQAIMKKGILTLKIQLGPPADGSDVQDIPVN